MARLILLRHGQSMWNEKNLFTGWVDVPLSLKGIKEAEACAGLMKDIPIDIAFSSTLVRGVMTAMLVLAEQSSGKVPVLMHESGKLKEWGEIYSEETKKQIVPVYTHEALNERMYGSLQGMNKQEMREKFGDEQVKIWRRSYQEKPPGGESLQMTAERAIPYFEKHIIPFLQEGKNVLIAAHGNSLRSLMKALDHLSDDEVVHLELATGVPVMYDYEDGRFTKRKNGTP